MKVKIKTPKQILKEKYLLIEDDRTVECHTHLVEEAMWEHTNQTIDLIVASLNKHSISLHKASEKAKNHSAQTNALAKSTALLGTIKIISEFKNKTK